MPRYGKLGTNPIFKFEIPIYDDVPLAGVVESHRFGLGYVYFQTDFLVRFHIIPRLDLHTSLNISSITMMNSSGDSGQYHQ